MLVKSLLGIKVSESKVYRVCKNISEQIDEAALNSPSEALLLLEANKEEVAYGMIDGSMVPMEEGWQEVKLGRVFGAEVKEAKELSWTIKESEYVGYRGNYKVFAEEFERLLPRESACKKVFITDGATWIGNWLSSSYENSTQILDFFHVCEKLAGCSVWATEDKNWFETQKENLLLGKHKKVCKAVAKLEKMPILDKEKLLNYLINNKYRMKYDKYRKKGYMISSGPIESAHRTVLQVRMKRSGQHWSEKGCDNMVKLRVAYRSNKFHIITNILRSQAA